MVFPPYSLRARIPPTCFNSTICHECKKYDLGLQVIGNFCYFWYLLADVSSCCEILALAKNGVEFPSTMHETDGILNCMYIHTYMYIVHLALDEP